MILLCAAVFLLLTACAEEDAPKESYPEAAEKEALEAKDAAALPDAQISEDSQMKEFNIIVHGVEDEARYLESGISNTDVLMTLTKDDDILLDACAPAVLSSPGYPLTIMCIPEDGVETCADRLVISTDFGGFYMRSNGEVVDKGQSFEMQADYTCYFTPTMKIDGAVSHNDVSMIKIIAYKGEAAVKEIVLKIVEDEGNHYISIETEE